VERRLAAIMAADVVGYSRLMGDDEVGTLTSLTVHLEDLTRSRIASHSGRVVKLMGDGVLAEFPSVVEAVQWAVEIQDTMAKRNREVPQDRCIDVRIGVNLGDVIVEGDDFYGDGVNVAARLEGLAWAGDFSIGQIGFLASDAAAPSELQAPQASIEGRLAEIGHAVQLFLVPVAEPLETKPESEPRPDLSRPASGQPLQ
jgi:class 3 adenylate cyclase